LLAKIARRLLDKGQTAERVKEPTPSSAKSALLPLGKVIWELHEPFWRYLLITPGDGSWKMRSEDRKKAISEAELLLRWVLGLDDLNSEDLAERKTNWSKILVPRQEPAKVEEMWTEVVEMRARCLGV
jgi:hypothetical protein